MSPASSAYPRADVPAAAGGGRRGSLLLVYRLGPKQAVAARRALAAGGEVVCLEADPAVTAGLGDGVRVLGAGALPGFEVGALADTSFVLAQASFDLAELGVAELLRRRPGIARWLARRAGSQEVDRYLCRSLLREVGAFFGLLMLVVSPELEGFERVVVERHWPNGPDFAFLADVVRGSRLSLAPSLAAGLARLSFSADESHALRTPRTAAHVCRELGSLWLECLRLVRLRGHALPQRPLLLRSYKWDWGLDRGGQRRLRNLDFVVDGETIRASDVGVWLDEGVPEERRGRLADRGYAVLSRADVTVGPLGFALRFLPGLLASTAVFVRLAAAERWWTEPVRRLLAESLLWREVGRRVRPRIFLTLNDLRATAIARTFALRRAGCLTVEYEFSSHWLTDERGWIPDYVYGFTVVDAMVTWGPLHSEHLRNHRGAIREYWDVGCLWSEHARLVRDGAAIGRPFRAALEEAVGRRLADFQHVVGVFDTSTATFFGNDDMVAFYAGVAQLARRLPHVLFVCKPKRPLEEVFANGAGGAEVEAALAVAPNVVVLDEYFETAVVVGLADLSVNACYTSPAVESIGLGRPAVYYDPTDLFPTSFFRRIPSLVATSQVELASLVDEQLALDDEARATDVARRFGDLEGHFDGLAITRLRERLRASLGV